MGLIGGAVGYHLLRRIARKASGEPTHRPARAELEMHFGREFFSQIAGKEVIDFGCGEGRETVEMAAHAARVTGVDIQQHSLDAGRALAAERGVSDRCLFTKFTSAKADVIVSKDAFEHFADPAGVLRLMHSMLKPEGVILASFGPTWLHPYGGHLFSVFPWAHFVFTERALIRWRSDFKTDGAQRFGEVAGGLNQMTIRRFERIVADSGLRMEWMDTVPIRGLSLFRTGALREFGSSLVRCRMRA